MNGPQAYTPRKRLFVMRHAEAEPFSARGGDITRDLTAPGRAQAASIGATLAMLVAADPMRIISSPARRTMQTASLVADALPGSPDLIVDDALYAIAPEGLFSLVHATPEDVRTVMIVGHNPTIAAFVHEMAGPRLADATLTALRHGYPPATLSVFDISGSWIDLRPSRVEGTRIHLP